METSSVFWSSNIKFLRIRKKLSQDFLAEALNMSRVKLNSHENGIAKTPPLEDLICMAEYFHLSIDTFLKVDLSKLTELRLRELEEGNDAFTSGRRIRVLSVTVDSENNENVEFVPIKAKAGYLTGYNDPEFVGKLPKFTLPHLMGKKTYRIFPTEGDSMLPIPENCFVITEYVADWTTLKDTSCIIIMKTEQGFLFKMVTLRNDKLVLRSLNSVYKDQIVVVGDVLEVWKYHSHITNEIPGKDNIISEILSEVKAIRTDMKQLNL